MPDPVEFLDITGIYLYRHKSDTVLGLPIIAVSYHHKQMSNMDKLCSTQRSRDSISIDDQDKRVKIIRAKKKFPYEERFSSLDFLSLRESYVKI